MCAKKAKQNEPAMPVSQEEKQQALDTALAQIEKDLGKGRVFRLGEKPRQNVDVIPTGSLALDFALGVGGLPRGRIIEIFGGESSGKTTLAYHCIAECQKAGGIAAFVDAEQSVDPMYAETLGVDIDNLFVSQPESAEEALEIMEALVRSNAVDMVVLDSVAALVPKQEIEGDMGASHVGLQARLMSQALRKLGPLLAKSNCVAIFINQLREKVGVTYGNPEITPGGRALKYWASVRIEMRGGDKIKAGGETLGYIAKMKVAKNKVTPPFKTANVEIVFGKGISKMGELIDIAVEADIIRKTGAWYNYGDRRLGQGRDKAKETLDAEPETRAEIEARVKEYLGSQMQQETTGEAKLVSEEEEYAEGGE